MIKEIIMFANEKGSILIPALLILIFAGIGAGAAIYTKQKDGKIEEAMEKNIEDEIEEVFDLPDDALKGKIDLTPGSKEVKDA